MQNKKLMAIPILLVLALVLTGFAYAHWEKIITINGTVNTGTLCAEFVPTVTKTDYGNDWTCDKGFINVRQLDKDVGSSSATIVASDKIEIVLTNVYPSYYEHISFWVHNCGSIPWEIQKVIFNPGGIEIQKPGYLTLDLNGDGKADVEIYWGDGFGTQTEPCEKLNISFEIHVLDNAPLDETLTFTAGIVVVNWNEYVPPP
jgi:hypothetical protein